MSKQKEVLTKKFLIFFMLQRIRLGNITYIHITYTIDTFLHKNLADIFISHKSKYTNLKAKISELCKDYLY